SGVILVDVEGHGREEVVEGLDVTRTVGWFTTMYPVVLELSGVAGAGAALKAVKEQLRGVPQRGIGYGLLRYVRGGTPLKRQAEVSFNYLGQFDQVLGGGSEGSFGAGRQGSGPTPGAGEKRRHELDMSGCIAGGRLQVSWSYSGRRYRRETMEELARAYEASLRELIEHCGQEGAGGHTPSDFPLANLDQTELNSLLKQLTK